MNNAKGYPALFEKQADGKIRITFRDIPEAVIEADSDIDAQVQAVHALKVCRDHYDELHYMWPKPSQLREGEVLVAF